MRNLWIHRRSVIMTWLISYVVVLFIPIVFSLAVYSQTEKTLNNQIERGSDSLLRQMQEAIDNQVASVKLLVAQIYANVTLQNLLYSNKFTRGDYRYDLYEITQDLKVFRSAYTTFDEFYIYWTPGDSVIMPYIYKEADAVYDDLYSGGEMKNDQWKQKLRSLNQRQFFRSSRKVEEGPTQHFLNYISSFPSGNNDQSVGSIVVMMNTKQLLTAIDNVRQFSGGQVFMLNEQNEVLVSSAAEADTLPTFPVFKGDTGSLKGLYNSESSQFYYIKSNNSTLTYVTIVPERLVWKEAAYVRKLTYFSIAFSLLGGIVLTVIFLRRNYKPLSKLMRSLAQQVEGTLDKGTNEFIFIEQALSKTMDEKEQIFSRMKQQNNQLRANFISRLFKGRIEAQIPHEDALAAFGIQCDSDQYGVILFYLEENAKYFERIEQLQVSDKIKLLHFIVTNVVEELVGQQHNGYMTEIDDMLACLVCLRSVHQEGVLKDLTQRAEEAQQFLKSKFEIEISVAISSIHTSTAGIAEAYKQSLDAMEYKLVMGKQEIIVYEELQKENSALTNQGYYYPLQVEQQLINYLKVGDVDKAHNVLIEIMERNFNQTSLSVELAKCLMFDLVSTFIKTMNEIGHTQETSLLNNPKAFEHLISLKTVKDMHQQLQTMLEEVCLYTAAKQEINKSKLKREALDDFSTGIKEFIALNYDDFNLNISMLGEAFSMKSTYLSKLFKDQTGESLLDYLNKVRMEKAKQLLKQEKVMLQEIANRCGFNDLNTFMRTFKKYEGITPGQFKLIE